MPDPVPSPRSAHDAQVERWTRLGQLVDSAPELDFAAIADVLAGRRSYDDIGDRESEVVRAVWDRRIAESIAKLDMTAELEARGTPYYSADAEGKVIEHIPGVGARPYVAPDEGPPASRG